MERPVLRAEIRDETGKGGSRKLRARGLIPAIFYGPKTESIPLIVDSKELGNSLKTEAGENVLINLQIVRDGKTDERVVMVKDLQIDPIQMRIIHADFYEVAMDVMVTVEVPIHLVGKPEGTKMGGILEQIRRVIQIQSLPGNIPKSIDLDVTSLKIGDSIHVKDIPAGDFKILVEPDVTIATVVPPVVEEKVAEAAVTAEAAPAEEEKEKGAEKEKGKEE